MNQMGEKISTRRLSDWKVEIKLMAAGVEAREEECGRQRGDRNRAAWVLRFLWEHLQTAHHREARALIEKHVSLDQCWERFQKDQRRFILRVLMSYLMKGLMQEVRGSAQTAEAALKVSTCPWSWRTDGTLHECLHQKGHEWTSWLLCGAVTAD